VRRRLVKNLSFRSIQEQTSHNRIMVFVVARNMTGLTTTSQIRCVTANSKVNKTTVQTVQSNRTQYNKWHTACLHVSFSKESLLGDSHKIF